MGTAPLLGVWKLKNRLHAVAMFAASLVAVLYTAREGMLFGFAWRVFAITQIHQVLMTLSHRLLFHETRGVVWKSPLLTFTLRNWMIPFWPEGFECVRAAHDTTQRSQQLENKCLSESMLWFHPLYMSIDRSAFVTPAYMARQTALELVVYLAAAAAWPHVSVSARLWMLAVFTLGPVMSRIGMYRGHARLHSPKESMLNAKTQNHTETAYERQAYNLKLRGSPLFSKYALGFLGLGDHLHNNHHHDPNALCQAHRPDELDGAYLFMRLFHRLGLIRIAEDVPSVSWRGRRAGRARRLSGSCRSGPDVG